MCVSNNPWIENTGTVPEGVTAETVVEVEYRYGAVLTWLGAPIMEATNDPSLWEFDDSNLDILRWRFV